MRREEADNAGTGGFVLLVEAALALFILAVGIVAAISLIGRATKSADSSRHEGQSAFFADTVFESLRAYSRDAAASNQWATFWSNFADGQERIPVPVPSAWANTGVTIRAGGPHTWALTNASLHAGTELGVPAVSLRYTLSIAHPGAGGMHPLRVEVGLNVWEGRFGGTNSPPQRYYAEFRDWGRLP